MMQKLTGWYQEYKIEIHQC